MAEFLVKPEDYEVGGRLYNKPDIVVVSPPGVEPITDDATGISYVPGSRAITVTKTTGGYAGLPQEVKDILESKQELVENLIESKLEVVENLIESKLELVKEQIESKLEVVLKRNFSIS